MEDILGKELLKGSENVPLSQIQDGSKAIGIYFGAHWAPPCRLFTTNLKERYDEWKEENGKFEVVFVSDDVNQSHFDHNFKQMDNWYAIPFGSED